MGLEPYVEDIAYVEPPSEIFTSPYGAKSREPKADGSERDHVVLRGHKDAVGSVAFSPSGDHIVTGSSDHTARIWKADGSERDDTIVLQGHEGAVGSVAFSHSGDHIVTGSFDNTARIWKASWPVMLAYLRTVTTECLTVKQRTRYLEESDADALSKYRACERSHGRSGPER